jgi:hypothetical protein
MAGWDAYGIIIAQDAPVGHWRLGDQVYPDARDSSGNGNTMIYGSLVNQFTPCLLNTRGSGSLNVGGSNTGGGSHENSVKFPDVVNQTVIQAGVYSLIGRSPVLEPTTAITLSCWVRVDVCVADATQHQMLVCYGSNASYPFAPYQLYHSGTTATNHVFTFAVNTGSPTAVSSSTPIVVGQIYYVCGTFGPAGSGLNVFTNSLAQTNAFVTGTIQGYGNSAIGMTFGMGGAGSGANDANLQGTLDEVAVYNKILTADRILLHFSQGSKYLPFNWRH